MSQAPKIDGYMLRELQELPLPEPAAYWPQTLGWQLLALALLIYALYQAIRLGRRWWRNRYRGEAIQVLKALTQQPLEHQVVELNRVLRLVADHAYPGQQVPRGLGQPFLAFLAQQVPGNLDDETARAWQQSLCLPQSRWRLDDSDMASLIQQGIAWVQQHPGGQA